MLVNEIAAFLGTALVTAPFAIAALKFQSLALRAAKQVAVPTTATNEVTDYVTALFEARGVEA
jgi:hypothetical protein